MPRVYAVVNQKGGVGKTTTAVNLSAGLALLGQNVLLIDTDPQGNSSSGVGVDKEDLKYSIYDVLLNEASLHDVRLSTSVDRLYVAPANIELTGAEVELPAMIDWQYRLKTAISKVEDDYDVILIDAPPSLGVLTVNALTAAHGVIVPIQCEYYALEGISQLVKTIEIMKRSTNSSLHIYKVVLTMRDPRAKLTQQVEAEIRKHFGTIVSRVSIPRNIRLSEAPSYGLPVQLYDPRSKGAEAYKQLSEEVLRNDNQ